jgi:hypothetical protein
MVVRNIAGWKLDCASPVCINKTKPPKPRPHDLFVELILLMLSGAIMVEGIYCNN